MSLIMGPIGLEQLGHIEYEHRSQMSLIMGQVIPDQSVLPALEIEK